MMEDCARFIKCNAMICPLDADWRERVHLSGERVCIYLLEYYKTLGSIDNIPDFICKSLDLNGEAILQKHAIIRAQVCKSAESRSKIQLFKDRIAERD